MYGRTSYDVIDYDVTSAADLMQCRSVVPTDSLLVYFKFLNLIYIKKAKYEHFHTSI